MQRSSTQNSIRGGDITEYLGFSKGGVSTDYSQIDLDQLIEGLAQLEITELETSIDKD